MANFKIKLPGLYRFFGSFLVFIFTLGLVYAIEAPDPAEAQPDHRICRGFETRWLFAKVNKGTRCSNLWVDVGPMIDSNGGTTFSIDGVEKEVGFSQVKGEPERKVWFRDASNYARCEDFTELAFPDLGIDDVCYRLDSTRGANNVSPASIEAETKHFHKDMELDLNSVITRGVIDQKEQLIDLGVCRSSGGCVMSYTYQEIDTIGAAVTVGGSAGFVATVTVSWSTGEIEGFIKGGNTKYGDRTYLDFKGWKKQTFTPDKIEFDPAFDVVTVNGCDARFQLSDLEELASEGESMLGQFEGLQTVYFGVDGCLAERKSTPSSMNCSQGNFGAVLYDEEDGSDGASDTIDRKCYLYSS